MESRRNLFGWALLAVFCFWGVGSAEGGGSAWNPDPPDGSNVTPEYWEDNIYMMLDYTPGNGAISHTAYFSDSFADVSDRDPAHSLGSIPPWPGIDPDAFIVGFDDPGVVAYARASLVPGRTYYWCVDADDGTTIQPGAVWSFTVIPQHAWKPTPADGAANIDGDPELTLSWLLGDIDPTGYSLVYDVYYGTNFAAVEAGTATTVRGSTESVAIGPLADETVYYWRVDTIRQLTRPPFGEIVVPGDIWQFTTMPGEQPVGDLIAHWKFDEGEGDTAYDSAGDNDGTIYGAAWVDGFVGGALDFDGVDDYARLPKIPLNDFSLSFWVWTVQDPSGGISGWWNGRGLVDAEKRELHTDWGTALATEGKVVFGVGGRSFVTIASTSSINNGDWHFVTGTRDTSTGELNLYVDGLMEAQGIGTTGTLDEIDFIGIGNNSSDVIDGDEWFEGAIDDVRIYNHVLSAGDVEELHGGGGGGGVYYVDAVSGNDGNDGLSPGTAFATIQNGIDSAGDGGLVTVAAGTYAGASNKNLDFGGRAITLKSADGPYATVIDCQGSGRGVYFHSGEDTASILDGFTITNGYVDDGSAGATWGGAIYCAEASSPTISNCILVSNTVVPTESPGGGLACVDSSPSIIGCQFIGNVCAGHSADGGGIYLGNSEAWVANCLFAGNSCPNSGGAAGVRVNGGSPTFTNCTIAGNSSTYSAGVQNAGGSTPLYVNCIIWGNSGTIYSPIANAINSHATFSHCDIEGGWDGPGVHNLSGSTAIDGGGNIDADPLFAGAGSGDYRLLGGSACIDMGDNSAMPALLSTDLDGNPRIANSVIDVGPFETTGAIPQGGLVAHWKFDEGGGSVASDSAGANDGTIYGAAWAEGVLGGALEFDGADDYVDCGYSAEFQLPVFTASAWILPKADLSIAGGAIVMRGEDETTDRSSTPSLGVRPTTSRWGPGLGVGYEDEGDDENVFGTDYFPVVGAWTHVVATRASDGRLSIYADGILLDEWDSTAEPASNCFQNLTIGGGWANTGGMALGGFFPGKIEDVRIYDVALSAGEIEELYGEVPPEPVGLVSHWRFDEGGGDVAYDSVGSNDGAIYGGEWVTGVLGDALSFNGVDDYVDCGNDDSLKLTKGTVSAWVKTCCDCPEAAGYCAIATKRYAYALYLFEDNFAVYSWGGEGRLDSGVRATDNQWYHVAFTFESGVSDGTNVYVDGILKNSGTLTIDHQNTDFTIGWSEYINQYFKGTIDDVRVYDVPLSAGEIGELFAEVTLPGEDWHVDGVLGSDDNDGLSSETAFFSIQKGIDSAEDGDNVLVWPGVYTEEVRFMGKAITVRSAGDAATIENPDDFAVSFYYGEGPGSVLENFVIANSLTGIFIAGSAPTISNVTVVNNVFGIEAYAGSQPDISNVILWDNIESDIYGCEAAYSWVQSDLDPAAATDGLVAHWKFDEGEGTTATDSAGENHGTTLGQVNWSSGRLGGGLDFDGVDGYVDAGNDPSLQFGQNDSFSISFWAMPVSTGEIICKMRADAVRDVFGYTVRRGTHDAADFGFIAEASRSCYKRFSTPAGSAPSETWHHVVTIYDNKNVKIYLNGELSATGTFSCNANDGPPDGPLTIGAKSWETTIESYFDGTIDDIRVHTRVLSAEEIQALYGLETTDDDPLFADPGASDYHLLSERGRYWAEHDVWVLDDVSSPCIDGGDLEADYSAEREPNGGIINIGAFGGTYYASMSEWLICGDMNGDGITNMVDFSLMAYNWLGRCGAPDGELRGP